ncbi:hypothetical protein E3N88_24332 [Mikania micrantha]|uniref:Uncharacterized protein n=1 Tax=Mikania micrantha TaxID=192012 RepID=A0A5N6N1X2_9ASTR|nr:hypothetical protein E3N88_24332 [Mikania micrantha]
MSSSGSQPFSFTFVPPPHQTTAATVVHTSTPAKSSAIRVDGEEASISSSDHAIPRIPLTTAGSVLPANLSSSGGGMIRAPSTLTGMSASISPPFYPYTPLMPPFNYSLPQTPIYTGTATMPMHSNAMVSFVPYGGTSSVPGLSPGVTVPFITGGMYPNTPVTPYPQYISNLPISPSQSILSTPTGSMSHEAILANLRTQLQFTGKSVIASAEWENRKNERKMANVPVQSSYAGRKSSVEVNMKSPPFRRETGRFAPYTPREVSIVARKKEEKQETYPALTKTPGEIWRTEGLKWEQSRPLRDNPARDKSRHCDYHCMHGHDTDDCWHLKKQIEKFVSNGDLKHLKVQKKGEKPSREEEKAEGKTEMEEGIGG